MLLIQYRVPNQFRVESIFHVRQKELTNHINLTRIYKLSYSNFNRVNIFGTRKNKITILLTFC